MEKKLKDIVIFGAGNNFAAHKQLICEKYNIIALVDNNPQKTGTFFCGIKIEQPIILNELDYDLLIITPGMLAGYQIRKQLESFGIPLSKMRFMNSGGVTPFAIDPEFFYEELTNNEKKDIFTNNVERIVLELNSKCNRRCWFCTNSLVDRHSENIDMDDSIFVSIISQLEEIKYDGDILLSYFNEPLCSLKIFDRIKYMRDKLPNSFIYAFSNGDYLKRENLLRLSESGLDMLWIDIYGKDNDFKFDNDLALKTAKKLFDRLQIKVQIDETSTGIDHCFIFNDMYVHVLARDFTSFAGNRAESLPTSLPIPHLLGHNRTCIKSFISFHIAYTGEVFPCPNYHRDFKAHKDFCIGTIGEDTMFDIFASQKFKDYREKYLFHRDDLPCRSCIWNFYSFVTNRFDRPFRDRPRYRR